MKMNRLKFVPLLFFFLSLQFAGQQSTARPQSKNPVLVELFTAEGCSTCPPADQLLIRLKFQQPVPDSQIIALGFHVDYWDHEGWRDRFSAHEFTDRQKKYAEHFHDEIFTPQLIVDGATEIRDGKEIPEVISKAGAASKPIRIELTQDDDTVRFQSHGNTPSAQGYLALVEDGLESSVSNGENKGRRLQHAAVVRDFHELGRIDKSDWSRAVQVKFPADGNRKHMQLVGFLQDPASGKVLGLSSIAVQ